MQMPVPLPDEHWLKALPSACAPKQPLLAHAWRMLNVCLATSVRLRPVLITAALACVIFCALEIDHNDEPQGPKSGKRGVFEW